MILVLIIHNIVFVYCTTTTTTTSSCSLARVACHLLVIRSYLLPLYYSTSYYSTTLPLVYNSTTLLLYYSTPIPLPLYYSPTIPDLSDLGHKVNRSRVLKCDGCEYYQLDVYMLVYPLIATLSQGVVPMVPLTCGW